MRRRDPRKIILPVLLLGLPFWATMAVYTLPRVGHLMNADWMFRRVQTRSALAGVNLADGLDREEAQAVAQQYFGQFVAGCGFAEDPTLAGDKWISRAMVGYGGDFGGTIEIDRRTGAIEPRMHDFFRERKGLPPSRRFTSYHSFWNEVASFWP